MYNTPVPGVQYKTLTSICRSSAAYENFPIYLEDGLTHRLQNFIPKFFDVCSLPCNI